VITAGTSRQSRAGKNDKMKILLCLRPTGCAGGAFSARRALLTDPLMVVAIPEVRPMPKIAGPTRRDYCRILP